MAFTTQFGKSDALSEGISDVATTATLSSGNFTNFTGDYLVIDYDVPAKVEVVKCTVTGTAVSSMTRAQEGTAAIAHDAGAKVGYNLIPTHYAALKDASGIIPTYYMKTSDGNLSITDVDTHDVPGVTQDVTVTANAVAFVIVAGTINFSAGGPTWTVNINLDADGDNYGVVRARKTAPTANTDNDVFAVVAAIPLTSGTTTIKLEMKCDTTAGFNTTAGYQHMVIIVTGR